MKISDIIVDIFVKKIKKKPWLLLVVLWGIGSFILGNAYINKNIDNTVDIGVTLSRRGQLAAFGVAYILAIGVIYFLCGFFYNAIKYAEKERKIIFYAVPICAALVAYLISDVYIGGGLELYYRGDEANIVAGAISKYPFFFIYSSELFLMCYLIFPFVLAPSLIKILFAALVSGYVIYRVNSYYKTYAGCFLYLIFLYAPVLQLGIRVHRMQWYAVLYLFVTVKLFFDRKDRKDAPFGYGVIAIMAGLISVLTIWRREGLYLILTGGYCYG
jgi:hypothetical protein